MLKVYSDLNCSFCFAQHQRLIHTAHVSKIEWCLVEHAPELDSQNQTVEQLQLLNEEFNIIRMRAPDIDISKPKFRVNTRIAILTFISIKAQNPEKAGAFLSAVFSAYWQQGRDISITLELDNILSELKIKKIPIISDAEDVQIQWQKEWEYGEMDLRIPAMRSEHGGTILGLQNIVNIENFIQSENENIPGTHIARDIIVASKDICHVSKKWRIGTINLQAFTQQLQTQQPAYQFEAFNDVSCLSYSGEGHLLDGLLVRIDAHNPTDHQTIQQLKHASHINPNLPIIAVADTDDAETESLAFMLGAQDFISLDKESKAFGARLRAHIKNYQTIKTLSENAYIDGLTGLLNKTMFNRMLEREWRISCRMRQPLSLLMIDVDHFKEYNDTYGHCEGDSCLQQIANTLKKNTLRPSDIIARFGGEEFVLLLPDTKAATAMMVAQRTQQAIQTQKIPHKTSRVSQIITASIGVCSSQPHADMTPFQLLSMADKAMYESKYNGRNQITTRELKTE